ncbi:Selenoprotein [Pycnococcus provasolii]
MSIRRMSDGVKGALHGLLIADALAMPTHWYYGGPRQVIACYGAPIHTYVKPSEKLAGSIMNKSATGGGGRGSFGGKRDRRRHQPREETPLGPERVEPLPLHAEKG